MYEVAEFVEFILLIVLLVIVFVVFMACFIIVDHYVKEFVGMMDSAINVSRPVSLAGWGWM